MSQPIEAEMLVPYEGPRNDMLTFSGTAEAQDKLVTEMAGAMAEFAPIGNVDVGQQGNRTFKYASLDVLRNATLPHLLRRKIVVLQPLSGPYGGNTYRLTTLVKGHGATITSVIEFERDGNLQTFGSQQTYLRRYAYRAMFLLDGSDDTDRGEDSDRSRPPEPQRPQQRPAQERMPMSPPAEPSPAATKTFTQADIAQLHVEIQKLMAQLGLRGLDMQKRLTEMANGEPVNTNPGLLTKIRNALQREILDKQLAASV
jgi:hypothetical protein